MPRLVEFPVGNTLKRSSNEDESFLFACCADGEANLDVRWVEEVGTPLVPSSVRSRVSLKRLSNVDGSGFGDEPSSHLGAVVERHLAGWKSDCL